MKRMCFLQVKGSADLVRFMDFLVEKTKDTIVPVAACKVLTEYSKRENDGLSYSVYYRRWAGSSCFSLRFFVQIPKIGGTEYG